MRVACRPSRCALHGFARSFSAIFALLLAAALPAGALHDEPQPEPPVGAGPAAIAPEASGAALAPAPGAPVPATPADADALDAQAQEEALLAEEDPFEDELFGEAEFESEFESEAALRDPFEGFNRGIFRFNRGVDYVLLDPITRGYQWLIPRTGRRAVHRFFLNLDTPVVLANQVLQVKPVDAAGTAARFVLNTTAGCAGFLDPGAAAGIPRTDADFGQTLARYGAPSGPYLMLPIFGPSTVRDGLGQVVDVVVDPVTYLLGPFQWWTLVLGGGEGLVVREATVADLEALEAGSIDFYSALRSAYLQSRDAAAREARGEGEPVDVVMSFGATPETLR
ncbi:MAG: VacJ family lipoprotein [Myxococcota bacterium]